MANMDHRLGMFEADLTGESPFFVPWAILHQRDIIELGAGVTARTSYPVIPWIGVIVLGYAMGPWFARIRAEGTTVRRLLTLGAALLVGFAAIGLPTVALGIWTFRSLGRNITDTVVTRREHTLITSGPYRYVRHPFYITTALAFTANALTTANWFIASTGFAALALLVVRTATEEGKLVERFGDDYRRYMARTGRFLPRLRSAPPTE